MKTVSKLKNIFKKIDEAQNPAEIEILELEVNLILEQNAQKPIEGVAEFLLERANILKQKVELVANEPEVKYKGVTYAFPEWITIINYCKLHGIKNPQTVSNWVKRGVISAHNMVIIKELNDLKLIRNVRYH
jgi:hypothetical protein